MRSRVAASERRLADSSTAFGRQRDTIHNSSISLSSQWGFTEVPGGFAHEFGYQITRQRATQPRH